MQNKANAHWPKGSSTKGNSMSDILRNEAFRDRFRSALDWTVFSLGVLSLGIAIGATMVTKTGILQSDADNGTATEIVVG